MNFLHSGKDVTPVTRQRVVYQIQCDCGHFYFGRTHQNLEKRLQQHKDDITKALNSNSTNIFFYSALSSNMTFLR
jgi:predicted GIY-YIG superfamily endonuclease